MMPCMDQALQASEYSLTVYTSQQNSTLLEGLNERLVLSALCTVNLVHQYFSR